MSADTNKAIVRRLFEEGVNERNYGVIDELVAGHFILHSAVLGEIHGATAYKQTVIALLTPCPDFQATIETLLAAEGDHVIARLTYRGTDTGGFLPGQAATGRPFTLPAIYIWRLAGGQLVELWQEADRLGMMQQLGALPAPTQAGR